MEKPMNELPLMETNEKNIVLFHPHISEKARQYVDDTLRTRWIGQGPKVDKFEKMFTEMFSGQDNVSLSCGSGTDALHLSYLLAGLKEGDEVIAPLFTCTATNIALLYLGVKINKNLNIGVYYLQGNGLQKDGLQTSHFVNLYLGVSNVALNDQLNLSLTPAVYYLNIDKKAGTYFTANGSISHKKSPFSLQSTINKILETKITGGKDFLWNIALVYKIK
jgi:hypothetical protein